MREDEERALRAACAEFADIPDEEWRFFWSQMHAKEFPARTHIVREGQPAPRVYFIVSGLVRLYYNREGRELVRGFDFENRWAAAYDSVLTGEPASFSIETIERTRTLYVTGDALRHFYNRHPCWDRFGRRILEVEWVRQADKARRFRVYSPEEHYKLLIARRWPIIDRVPLNQLASYLHITPETLSRIRARIRSEGEPAAASESLT